jgi:trk system potassium uptake protein TrkA
MTENCRYAGSLLKEIKEDLVKQNTTIIGVSRGEEFWIPSDKEIIVADDEIYLVTDTKSAPKTMTILGHEETEARKLAIIGGGNIGLYIAQALENENRDTRIKIIELNKARAEKIADELDRTTVINGSALDKEILDEANVGRAETVICVSNDDEVNILSALLAKTMGAQVTYALINNHSFLPLMPTLGIDVTVNPRETTISSILRHVRRGRIRSAHTLKEGKAEVMEAEVSENLGMVGKPLSDLELPEDVLVGAIIRNGEFVKPDPDAIIKKRDRLIIMALAEKIHAVEDMFSLETKFF